MATGIWYYFNPHSHEGSDQLSPVSLQKHADFNPHSHEGSDFILSLHVFITVISIHTPTKGVTCFQIQREQSAQISIHTPTKGVTIKQYYFFLPDPISIHTPTKGVTGFPYIFYTLSYNFNPHSHEGSDVHKVPRWKMTRYFNPHSHEGSDRGIRGLVAAKILFQSTLPRRE